MPWVPPAKLGEHLEKNGRPWIAGDALTLAEVSWMVILDLKEAKALDRKPLEALEGGA